jgi:hypothetical protein
MEFRSSIDNPSELMFGQNSSGSAWEAVLQPFLKNGVNWLYRLLEAPFRLILSKRQYTNILSQLYFCIVWLICSIDRKIISYLSYCKNIAQKQKDVLPWRSGMLACKKLSLNST